MEATATLVGGRYEIGPVIAQLKSAALHQAVDRSTGHEVTVWVSTQEWGNVLVKARSLAYRMALLRHRNLPRVIDMIEEGRLYCIQEKFAGLPVPAPLEPELVRRYFTQVMEGVAYLHDQGLIHGALGPANLLVSPHGTIQVVGLETTRDATQEDDIREAGQLASWLGEVPADLAPLISRMTGTQPPKAAEVLQQLHADSPPLRLPQFLLAPEAQSAEAEAVIVRPVDEDLAPHKRSMWSLLIRRKKGSGKPEVTHVAPDDSGAAVAEMRASFPVVELQDLEDLTHDVARTLPETAARSIQGICFGLKGRDMHVAVKDPSIVYIYDHVDFATHGRYRAVLHRADSEWIDRAQEWAYQSRSQVDWRNWVQRRSLDAIPLEVANPMADTSRFEDEITHPIVEATERTIKEALAVGTSDIHLEAFETRYEVRYRIDGVLQPAATYSLQQGSAMVKRIKVMANMDVAQERMTQGGRISLTLGDKKYDLRVSVIPVGHGENVVMRVLKKGSFNLTLADLGLDEAVERRFRAALSQPHGIILVCGPTGSGKSTTLYASIKELMRPDRKLLTVEDPVEYEIDGLMQVQVNLAPQEDEQKLTFAKVLKEFLRHDPEVILVGEIRDPETAAIALQASLTGHLVLSTLHTNDSIGLVSRLRDMGCKSYLVASTLRCGLSQRLARRICPSCKEEIPVAPEVMVEYEREGVAKPYHQFRGRGCKECLQTGYRGRVGVYEVLEVDAGVRSLIAREAGDDELLAHLQSHGFRTLYQNGLDKVNAGLVSFEEVQRVCYAS